ncbi:MAG: primosomal replication protein N [Zoogloeaceae bacterium]|nr:primosomal replication protein N [Zoogloeaceae bacterium]
MSENRVVLEGWFAELKPLRISPAGIPVLECMIAHESRQVEGGLERQVSCEMRAVVVGDLARVVVAAKPGIRVRVEGFLAARGARNRAPVLHLNTLKFLEGTNHGIW